MSPKRICFRNSPLPFPPKEKEKWIMTHRAQSPFPSEMVQPACGLCSACSDWVAAEWAVTKPTMKNTKPFWDNAFANFKDCKILF